MGDLEAVMTALRDLEASSDPDPDLARGEPARSAQVLDLVAAAPRSARPGDHQLAIPSARPGDHELAIMRSQAALFVREALLVLFTTVCGVAALAFAWLLLRP
jgi:hypothetical protein